MKLLGILKEKFDKAETIEDKKKVLTEVGIELRKAEPQKYMLLQVADFVCSLLKLDAIF